MKLIELHAQNIKKLKLVHIAPKGPVTVIAGRNGQGKTTTLDVLQMLFGGAKAMPLNPIRRGESSAKASADLGDLVVEMTLDANRGRTITVRGRDGKKIPGGEQEILNRLRSAIAFDPQEFASSTPEEQADILRKLVGCDTSGLDAQIKKIYAEREVEGRDLAKAKAQLSDMAPVPEGTPDKEVSVTSLLAEKDAADKANAAHARVFDSLEKMRAKRARMEGDLEKAKQDLEKAKALYDQSVANEDSSNEATTRLPPDIDVTPIVEAIGSAEIVNRSVRAKKERASKAGEVDRLEGRRVEMTHAMAAIEAEKQSKLDAIKWPIEGLGFSDGIVTYKGFALSESSTSERIKVGLAIGMASHPELQAACIRDGSSLDDEAMDEIERWAIENDFNIMIERVGTDDPGSVIIEDGISRDWTPEDAGKRLQARSTSAAEGEAK